jgi:hypothetical protein
MPLFASKVMRANLLPGARRFLSCIFGRQASVLLGLQALLPLVPDPRSNLDQERAPSLADSAARHLELRLLRTFRLGDHDSVAPVDVKDVFLRKRLLFVLDGEGRRLLGYDVVTGRRLFSSGRWGNQPGSFNVPRRMEFLGDTLLILDVTHTVAFSAFDAHGRFIGQRAPLLKSIGGTAFAPIAGRLIVTTLAPREASGGRDFAVITDADGRVLSTACREDPRYQASRQVNGELYRFAFRDVAVSGDRVFCTEPISPRIQILGPDGRLRGVIEIAPPFYQRPKDVPSDPSRTKRDILVLESSWTSHTRIFGGRNSFISVYAHYDLEAGEPVFYLFSCALDGHNKPSNCRSALSPGSPVRFRPPDSLFVVVTEKRATRTQLQLHLYQIR